MHYEKDPSEARKDEGATTGVGGDVKQQSHTSQGETVPHDTARRNDDSGQQSASHRQDTAGGQTADSHQDGRGQVPGAASQEGVSSIEQKLIENQVIEAIRTCYDPEIPVNIYDLGLVYDVRVDARGGVTVIMTLTSPHCPAAQTIPKEVEVKARAVQGATSSKARKQP